ncbi:MAG: hypothetical protein AAGI15_11000, partial [Pseudomonadota bacterium]
ELVVVNILLGSLSAVALPRFVDMGSSARAAVMQDLEGKLRVTDQLVYGKAMALGIADQERSPSSTVQQTGFVNDAIVDQCYSYFIFNRVDNGVITGSETSGC